MLDKEYCWFSICVNTFDQNEPNNTSEAFVIVIIQAEILYR